MPRRLSCDRLLLTGTAAAAVLTVAAAAGQPAAARSGDAELRRLLAEQQRQIERLQQRLDAVTGATGLRVPDGAGIEDLPPPDPRLQAQQRELEELRRKVDGLEQTRVDTTPRDLGIEGFDNAFRIPGTDAFMKIGGYVKLDAIYDADDIASEDLFVTSTINTDGNQRQGRTRLHARQSRLNVDVREATEYGPLRVFAEGDFFGGGGNQNATNSSSFRLRHAFGELGNLVAGQTWSTFMDVAVIPDTLDFEGPNSELFVRQALIRWTQPLSDELSLAFAIENPEGDFSNDNDLNLDRLPDGVLRLRWEPDGGHLQTAFLARELRFDDGDEADSEFGYGLTLSGSLELPFLHPKDLAAFQINYGDGIGRYITDLGGGGFDALVEDGQLDTTQVFGVMVQGQHWWADDWRSTLAYGYLAADSPSGVADTTLEQSQYLAANLIWTPVPRVDIGVEYLWGQLETEDGNSGTANRVQASVTYRF